MSASIGKYSLITLTLDQDIARLTLCSPPVNAMSQQLTSEISAALDELEKSNDWSVLQFASNQKVFSAGGDLSLMSGWFKESAPGDHISKYAAGVQGLMNRIAAIPNITMAEVGGPARRCRRSTSPRSPGPSITGSWPPSSAARSSSCRCSWRSRWCPRACNRSRTRTSIKSTWRRRPARPSPGLPRAQYI